MIRLVATDLDGTLLRDDKSVTAWTRSVLDAAAERGLFVVPVTARQPKGITEIAERTGLLGWTIAVNGALGYHATTGEVAFEHLLGHEARAHLVAALTAAHPDVRFALVGQGGHRFLVQPGYAELARPGDHNPAMLTMTEASLDELVATPALKIVARTPSLPARELALETAALGLSGVHATWSGADFIEVAAGGVTKATGVADLCAALGIDRSEVAAFGDAPNDIEMLQWAGHSWAMPRAEERVKQAAQHLARDNNDDGVAREVIAFLR